METRSVTEAASAIGITQPAVSTQIARLEEALGLKLFDRSGGRLRPTPEALLFYAETARVMGGVARLGALADDLRETRAGRLTIASHPAGAISLLPPLVAAFSRERPDVHVRLIARDSGVVRNLLPTESFDIGLAEWPVSETDAKVERHRLPCVAILPAGHPLARHATITPALLSGEPFVATYRSHRLHHRLGEVFADAGARWTSVAEVEFFSTAYSLVAAGLGAAVVDLASARHHAPLGLTIRPFAPALSYELGLFRARDRAPSLVAEAFHAMLTAHLHALAAGSAA